MALWTVGRKPDMDSGVGALLGHWERSPLKRPTRSRKLQERRLQGHPRVLTQGLGWVLAKEWWRATAHFHCPGSGLQMFTDEHLSHKESAPEHQGWAMTCSCNQTLPSSALTPTHGDPCRSGKPRPASLGVKKKECKARGSVKSPTPSTVRPETSQLKHVLPGKTLGETVYIFWNFDSYKRLSILITEIISLL